MFHIWSLYIFLVENVLYQKIAWRKAAFAVMSHPKKFRIHSHKLYIHWWESTRGTEVLLRKKRVFTLSVWKAMHGM